MLRRGKRTQYASTSLIQITGVASKEEVDFYLGKRLAYVYKAKTLKKNTKYRVMWGKVGLSQQQGSTISCAAYGLNHLGYTWAARAV